MADRSPLIGLAALLVLAVVGKSAVMAVSVVGMAVAWGAAREAGLRRRLGAVAVAAVGAALVAEAVHTGYHRLVPGDTGDDTGGFFLGATLVGGINAAAFVALMLVVEWVRRAGARGSAGG